MALKSLFLITAVGLAGVGKNLPLNTCQPDSLYKPMLQGREVALKADAEVFFGGLTHFMEEHK